MPFRRSIFLLASLITLASVVRAQTPPASQGPSLQQQVEDLRAGQRRILEELVAIRARLDQPPAASSALAAKPSALVAVNVFGEPFRGAGSARVAILEYSDFDCPFCKRYARTIYPQIDEAYVRTGKVKYFFRDLPLPEHPNAPYKAQVARCAGEQGKFWEAHDRLFEDQRPLDADRLAAFIRELGLDPKAFHASLDSGKYAEPIRMSARSAERLQIPGAPAFLIGTLGPDGRLLTVSKILLGAESFEAFKDVLDPLLAGGAAASAPSRDTAGGSCE